MADAGDSSTPVIKIPASISTPAPLVVRGASATHSPAAASPTVGGDKESSTAPSGEDYVPISPSPLSVDDLLANTSEAGSSARGLPVDTVAVTCPEAGLQASGQVPPRDASMADLPLRRRSRAASPVPHGSGTSSVPDLCERPVPVLTAAQGATNGSVPVAASSGARAEAVRFWKPAVGRLYDLYLEKQLQDVIRIFLHLDVTHWRQLLEFSSAVRAFLRHAPYEESPAPPQLPADVLAYIGSAYLYGQNEPPVVSELSEPLWYMEVMVLLRLLIGGKSSKEDKGRSELPRQNSPAPEGLPTPPLVVQFLIHTLSSSGFSSFLFTAGSQGREAAWARHGGDVLLAMQHVIVRLYPEEAGSACLDGPRLPVASEMVPSVTVVCLSAALQFSSHLLVPTSSASSLADAQGWCKTGGRQNPETSGNDYDENSSEASTAASSSSSFSAVLRCLSLMSRSTAATKRVGDRFLLCLGDVLRQLLGPAPRRLSDLPEPVPPLDPASGKDSGAVDIKDLGRIVRTILHAHNTDPARLAAREDGRRKSFYGVAADQEVLVDQLCAGSFAGPSEPGDFVPVVDQGPLRRSLAFMEQSALLHVVQTKLCEAHFADVVGSTEQLSLFALRNISVLWFDLRRCTSTLKQDPHVRADDAGPSGASVMLVLRNLRLGLAPDWEAKLAKFPYLHLAGSSRVTVKSLVITVRFSLSHGAGIALRDVDIGIPDLDIQLICMSTLSQLVLSAVLAVVQDTLKEHIQKQLHKHILQLLRHEFSKVNQSVWKFFTSMVPERLISQCLHWFGSSIPPEGLPI